MVLSNSQQIEVLLYSLLFGACLGVVYDLFRAFRFFVPCPAVAVFFQDTFYFLTAAVASFLFIFEVNDGSVRLFILLAFLAGGLGERFTLGLLLLRFCALVKKTFSRFRERKKQKKPHKHSPKARDTDCAKDSNA